MKKKIISLVLVLCSLFTVSNVSAEKIDAKNVPAGSYIIGNYLFTREGSSEYGGTLKTEYIMVASKSIDSSNADNMNIYYKKNDTTWLDAFTAKTIVFPENTEFEIVYKNNVSTYELGDINYDGLVDYNDLQMLAKYLEVSGDISESDKKRFDLNSDDKIDMDDLIILHKHLYGISGYETLPVNKKYEKNLYGKIDINGDSKVDIDDAIHLFRYSMQPELYPLDNEITKENIVYLDLNLDGILDISDAVILEKYLEGNYESVPVIYKTYSVKYGDYNNNGTVDKTDLQMLYADIKRETEFNFADKMKLDLNLDGKVDMQDVVILHKHLYGISGYETLPMKDKTEEVLYGKIDQNGDGNYDIDDAVLLFKFSMLPELYPLDENATKDGRIVFSDVNLDCVIDIDDAVIVNNNNSGKSGYQTLPVISSKSSSSGVLGDLDRDKKVDVSDLNIYLRYLKTGNDNLFSFTDNEHINGDDIVDLNDVIIVHKHIMGVEGYETLDNTTFAGKTETDKYGDVNGDGTVDVNDFNLLLDYLYGSNTTLTATQKTMSDVNLDGKVNFEDAFIINGYVQNKPGYDQLPYLGA